MNESPRKNMFQRFKRALDPFIQDGQNSGSSEPPEQESASQESLAMLEALAAQLDQGIVLVKGSQPDLQKQQARENERKAEAQDRDAAYKAADITSNADHTNGLTAGIRPVRVLLGVTIVLCLFTMVGLTGVQIFAAMEATAAQLKIFHPPLSDSMYSAALYAFSGLGSTCAVLLGVGFFRIRPKGGLKI